MNNHLGKIALTVAKLMAQNFITYSELAKNHLNPSIS